MVEDHSYLFLVRDMQQDTLARGFVGQLY